MPVQRTSLDAYRHLKDSGALARQIEAVFRELTVYREQQGRWPTGYELFEHMFAKGLARDLNDVRPTLTHLKEVGRVINPSKRSCAVTGKQAFIWQPKEAPVDPQDQPPPGLFDL